MARTQGAPICRHIGATEDAASGRFAAASGAQGVLGQAPSWGSSTTSPGRTCSSSGAARLLRPGGELVFLVNGTLLVLCFSSDGSVPAAERLRLLRDAPLRVARTGVDFHIGYGAWIRLFRENGLEVEDLIEIQAPEDGDPGRWDFVTLEWARRWPSEEIWKARKR